MLKVDIPGDLDEHAVSSFLGKVLAALDRPVERRRNDAWSAL
ncbi:MAG TPA: hypothetical protein PLK78_16185 [Verrucomicrobiota bacterium]|nr:hypothetical protein [Verrucomicrobiota bacterium]